jgi:hypothetical protein
MQGGVVGIYVRDDRQGEVDLEIVMRQPEWLAA